MKFNPSFHFFLLYFFEGAPIGLVWWAIPTLMASSGVTVDIITSLTAMAALPWTFKFILGPFVDRYFFSTKSYALSIALFQFFMLLALVGLLLTSIEDRSFFWITILVSSFSAVQDVFIDAWAIGSVSEDQRGSVNGYMQAGLLTGRWLFGSGLLILLSFVSWKIAVGTLAVLIGFSILNLILTYGKDNLTVNPSQPQLGFKNFNFILTKKFLFLASIAISTGFAFESFGSVVGPFLLSNGYEKKQVGYILSATLLTMLAGAVLGGKLADRNSPKTVFLASGTALCVLVPALGYFHLYPTSWILIFLSGITYFFIGSFTSSSYTFYMENSRGKMEATRFTFLMAMTNLCESISALFVGKMIFKYSYFQGFLMTSFFSLLGILALWIFFDLERFKNSDN